jgi:O-antigen ligase
MSLLILDLFALLRPILLMNLEVNIFGFSIFELAAIAFLGLLLIAIFVRISLGKRMNWSDIDILIALYIIWSISISLIYPDKTDLKDFIKWITPYLTWFAARNIIQNRNQYLTLTVLLMIGLGITILISTVFIFLDLDISRQIQLWGTKQILYQGAFADSHHLGFATGLFISLGVIYATIVKTYSIEMKKSLTRLSIVLYFIVSMAAIYCLFKASVRTVMIGLIIFFAIYLFRKHKVWLIIGASALALSIVIAAPLYRIIFFDVVQVAEGDRPLDRIGTSRPVIWMHNLSEFSKLTIDRKVAGAGIGNVGKGFSNDEYFESSHNDFLRVFIHTGIVGFVIFLLLHLAIFRRILAFPGNERDVFLAMFISVIAMNFATNAYVTFYGFAQIYYLVFSYIVLESIQAIPTPEKDHRRKLSGAKI